MKRSTVKRTTVLLAAASAILLSSCIGIDADARIAADGSVELAIVYTVSSAVDELGKLGANAGYLPLPVGRNDLELAASRAGGELRSRPNRPHPLFRAFIEAALEKAAADRNPGRAVAAGRS